MRSVLATFLSLTAILPAVAAPSSNNTPAETQVAEAAKQFLSSQAARDGVVKPVINVVVATKSRMPNGCAVPLSIAPSDGRRRSRMQFVATCPDQDGWREPFIVRVEMSAEVLVAANSVPAGHILSDLDIELERRDISNLADVLSDTNAVLGQSTRRPLRAGQVLAKQMLAAPLLVKRGESVRILVRRGAIEVNAAGEALEAGQRDDIVRVRNSNTGKVIRARVTEFATVEPVEVSTSRHSID